MSDLEHTGLEIAVIGMAGRFPGAKNIDEFWQNLIDGVESISFFSDQELEQNGVPVETVSRPEYVRAKGVLENVEYFDAAFFNFTPGEAEIMDPQLRVFMECAWHAMEDGGYDPGNYDGAIGLYAGNSINHFWIAKTMFNKKYYLFGQFKADLLNTHFSTQVSYHLNLKGPAMTIQTACSTSLVTIHQACLALLSSECEMALAGGVSLSLPQRNGYMFQEGMVGAPDGHCRPFDKRGKGTVSGSGAGAVLLKRLEDAESDNDRIYAVIKGSAINNDGVRKVGYTAPSVEGQAEAIRAAYVVAEVEPRSISYIETHGTATELGDPVELEALSMVFQEAPPQSIRIGSVKSNIGHLDSASGVAGFIKTVLALYHKNMPPSLHFENPNPKTGLKNTPFQVNNCLTPWKPSNGLQRSPLRAGVSSFGLGGTNAHVVLESYEQDLPITSGESIRDYFLVMISANSPAALDAHTTNIQSFMEELPDEHFADAVYTLQANRKAFSCRRFLTCSNRREALELFHKKSRFVKTMRIKQPDPPVVFLFSGQGAQYAEMGLGLYRNEPYFRNEMDRCFRILKTLLDIDLKMVLYGGSQEDLAGLIDQTHITQPLVFAFEYALAGLLMHWGIHPRAMIGYSMGEYLAACISGVFSLEDALKLIVERGKLMKETAAAAMLSVPLPEYEVRDMLPTDNSVSIAIINGPTTIITGEEEAVQAFEDLMKQKRLLCAPVNMGHGVHSPLMENIRHSFEHVISSLTLNAPQIPYVSNVSGNWMTPEDAVDPAYYGNHMCSPVRFSDGIDRILEFEQAVFVEIGPGRLLSNILRQHSRGEDDKPAHYRIVNIVKHQQEKKPDDYYLLNKLGELWLYGVSIDWSKFYSDEKRHHIDLPLYPFDRKRYWIDEDPFQSLAKMLSGQIKNNAESTRQSSPDAQSSPSVSVPEPTILQAEVRWEYAGDESNYTAPRDDLEQAITQLWQDFLGFERIGIHDNFFEINGDSLTATQLISRLQQQYPVEISLQVFFEEPTIARLAETVKQLLTEKVNSLSEEELNRLADML